MSEPPSVVAGTNVLITGGTFNQSVARTHLSISFDKLAAKASPRAFHLADSDLSHSTCFTNTRTKILEHLKGWALRDIEKDKFVMWLYGPAGGGKTAIGRTMAKWCEEEQGILLGEFFFSRADGTGAQLASLAPTLAYRLAVHTFKDAKTAISDVISCDPHIFLAPLAIQLKKLVLEPLDIPCSITPYVIILDGLDETLSPDDQQLVLNVISDTLYPFDKTLRILICSRPEPTIVTAFNDPDSLLNAISTNISLNDDVDSDADIRAFLVEKFARIKKQLPHSPSGEWPTPANIDYIVAKSSRQFIFAATVEKYVCSPKHRHQAVTRLKHILNLRLLPHLEDKKKHPFADLDALYTLILRSRNDADMSIKATAVCLEYVKYFNNVSPVDLAKVLHIKRSKTWEILYELASLFDVSKKSIRPFHASFGDFLFDRSRSHDLFCIGGDIVADIAYAKLRRGHDPEVFSYHIFSRLLGEATPRQDLRDMLGQMTPDSIFKRPSRYSGRSKEAYYLIPLLRQLERHVSSDIYKNLVAYFDQNFSLFLPSGRWRSEIFAKVVGEDKGNVRAYIESDSDSHESSDMPGLQSVSNTSEDSAASERIRRGQTLKAKGLEPGIYRVSDLTPLSILPAWGEINAQLNIRLTGPDSLQGLCDEAHFVRSRLTKTSSVLLNAFTQAKAAHFCLEQITDENTTEDLRIAFAKLLPHSLSHARQSPELTTNIQILLTQHPALCKRLPSVTTKAIADYLRRLATPSGSQKPRTAAGVVPKASPAPQHPPSTVPTPSTKATAGQKASTTPTSSIARRRAQKSSPSSQPPSTADSKHRTPSQPQPVPRTFLVPSCSTQIQPSPSTSQKASSVSRIPQKKASTTPTSSTARQKDQESSPPSQPPSNIDSKHRTPSQPQPVPRALLVPSHSTQTQPSPSTSPKASTSPRPPSSTGLKISNPSQTQLASCPPQSRTRSSSNASQKPSTVSRTPEQANASQPAMTLDPDSSAAHGPPTTSGATFRPSHISNSLTRAQAPSDGSQRQGPRRGETKKGSWK